MCSNYVKLNRKLLDWEWYKCINTKAVFLHMLLKANWKEGNFKGTIIPRGAYATSKKHLSEEIGLTMAQVRTAIQHLEKTGEIEVYSTKQYSIFIIKKYDFYQSNDKNTEEILEKKEELEPTLKQPTNDTIFNQQITKEENLENLKVKGKEIDEKEVDNQQITVKQLIDDIQITTIEKGKEKKKLEKEIGDFFEKIWKNYPNKKGKANVSLQQKRKLYEIGEENLIRALERYLIELKKDSSWRKLQYGSTFFNKGYVDYLDENYQVKEEPKKEHKNQFLNFQQRQYQHSDYSKLEEMLLKKQKIS